MKKITKVLVGGAAALALTFGGASTAAMAYPPGTPAVVKVKSTGTAGKTQTVTGSKYKPGATVSIVIGGKTYKVKVNSAGKISKGVKLPSKAGKYKLTVKAAGEKTITKTITIGKAFKKATVKASKITKKKTKKSTIRISGAKSSYVLVTVTGPKGVKKTTKKVKIGKSGKANYSYKKATKKGTYKVTVKYYANSKYYGAKSYTTSFKKTK